MSPSPDVLVVGPAGKGGIAGYVAELADRLPDRLDVATYTGYTSPEGTGLSRVVRVVFHTMVALVQFPFQQPAPDVHVHTAAWLSFFRSAWYVFWARFVWDSRVVLHVHSGFFDEFLATDLAPVRWVQRVVFGTTDDVVVLSEGWADVVEPVVDGADVHVVPNGVDPDGYDPRCPTDPVRIVFLSYARPDKGVREFARAIDRLEGDLDRSYEVHLAGTGPCADRFRRLAREYEHVTYHGHVTGRRKRTLLSSSSVFVLPSHAEGMPIAMLEAMAAGNAVVSTPVGSIPDVLDGDQGILVEPGDAEALAGALRSLVADPDRVTAMARASRRRVESYTWDAVVRRTLAVYGDGGESDGRAGSDRLAGRH